jgi:hypothetical protein
MTKVILKYNPFLISTLIKIDGTNVSEDNSFIKFIKEQFQITVDELVLALIDRINDHFEIEFHGRRLDYNDLEDAIKNTSEIKNRGIKITTTIEEVKHHDNILQELISVFNEIQTGPFDDLKTEEINTAFKNATENREFEVCVIATMSAGKSTLINSIIGKKLMPSKNQACTAIIVRIKDVDGHEKFKAKVYDIDNKLIVEYPELTPETLKEINENKNVSYVSVEGDIPYISSKNFNMVLVDTPGPNNANDGNHKEITHKFLKNQDKGMILYVLDTTNISSNDNDTLFKQVAQAMENKGKKSKERFLFVINKIDAIDVESGSEDVNSIVTNARNYLQRNGIENPNIFPVSAELARLARIKQKDEKLTFNENETLNSKTRYFTQVAGMNMIDYCDINQSARIAIKEQIDKAGNDFKKAEFYSGIPAIEYTINNFLEKYATPTLVKDATDSFFRQLEAKQITNKLKEKMIENEKERNEISKTITIIQEQLNKGENAKQFQNKIDDLKPDFSSIDKLRELSNQKFVELAKKFKGEVAPQNANNLLEETSKKIENIIVETKVEAEILTQEVLIKEAKNMIEVFNKYIDGIITGGGLSNNLNFNKSFFTINLPSAYELVANNKREKTIKTQEAHERSVFNPKRWFGDKYYYEIIEKKIDVVNLSELRDKFLFSIQNNYFKEIDELKNSVNNMFLNLKNNFNKEIENISKIIENKLIELKDLSNNKEKLEEDLKNDQFKNEWLKQINTKLKDLINI